MQCKPKLVHHSRQLDRRLTSKTWLLAGGMKVGSGQLKSRSCDNTGIPDTSSVKIATTLLHLFLCRRSNRLLRPAENQCAYKPHPCELLTYWHFDCHNSQCKGTCSERRGCSNRQQAILPPMASAAKAISKTGKLR